ncbi:PREDICTED: uncharacterized protein LOC108563076 [Nicrophorus vespilloides]|uniref:Uncharacterized protein LOC108563076 n=1 Tax=Nicrophorus vespilloides TaxID=110193 RepID=A0ABM1MRD8_NICVS|nr:PREDICTED: uncharacterized protein LOC108563076 [Nicrophorus vespilloides]
MGIHHLPLYVYVVLKNFLFDYLGSYGTPIAIILTAIVSIISLPVCLILLLIRFIISLIPRLRYKSNFVGMMNGTESSFNMCQMHMMTILYVEHDESFESFRTLVEDFLKAIKQSEFERLFYFRGSVLGYPFFYKKNLMVSDHILVMDDCNESDILTDMAYRKQLHKYQKNKFLVEDGALFQAVLCKQPIEKRNRYALNLISDHCCCDGNAMITMLRNFLERQKVEQSVANVSKPKTWRLHNMELPGIRVDNGFGSAKIVDQLVFGRYFEDEPIRMSKVKSISKKLNSAKFFNILSSCLCCALYDYFGKRSGEIPKTLKIAMSIPPPMKSDSFGILVGAVIVKLPIGLHRNSPIRNLEYLEVETKTALESFDSDLLFWVIHNLSHLFPVSVLRFSQKFLGFSAVVSNFLGCDQLVMPDGSPVSDLIIFPDKPPESGGEPMQFLVYSYKKCLRISLALNRNLVNDLDHTQRILDETMNYLDHLHEQIVIKMEKFKINLVNDLDHTQRILDETMNYLDHLWIIFMNKS